MHIKEFYSCKNITLASELYYICELGKYLYHYTGKGLDIRSIEIDKIVEKSQLWVYFGLALKYGWLISDIKVDLTKVYWPYQDKIANIVTYIGKVDSFQKISEIKNYGVSIEFEREDNVIVLKPSGSYNKAIPELVYVSYAAHIIVKNKLANTNIKSVLVIKKTDAPIINTLTHFVGLADRNCFNRLVTYKVDNSIKSFLEYKVWEREGFEKGLLYKEWSNKDKLNYLGKIGLEQKDVVFIYDRDNHHSAHRPIKNVELAVIDKITPTNISFRVILNPRLREDIEHDYNKLNPKLGQLFSKKDLNNLKINKKTFSISDIGIGQMLGNERYFIESLENTKDTVKTYMDSYLGNLIKGVVEITQEEFIARVLRENNIEFNAKKYREICFKNGAVVQRNEKIDFRVIPQEIKVYNTRIRILEDGTVLYNNSYK